MDDLSAYPKPIHEPLMPLAHGDVVPAYPMPIHEPQPPGSSTGPP
jgi:hypothetical protein